MGNILGGLLGEGVAYQGLSELEYRSASSLRAQQAAQEAAMRAQMQAYQNQYNISSINHTFTPALGTATTSGTVGNTITITNIPAYYTTSDKFQVKYENKQIVQDQYAPVPPKPKLESNIEWLNRRVREMRVEL